MGFVCSIYAIHILRIGVSGGDASVEPATAVPQWLCQQREDAKSASRESRVRFASRESPSTCVVLHCIVCKM